MAEGWSHINEMLPRQEGECEIGLQGSLQPGLRPRSAREAGARSLETHYFEAKSENIQSRQTLWNQCCSGEWQRRSATRD